MKNLTGCVLVIALVLLSFWVGGVCVQYDITTWSEVLAHKHVSPPFFPCAVAGVFVASIATPLAVVTWCLRSAGVI